MLRQLQRTETGFSLTTHLWTFINSGLNCHASVVALKGLWLVLPEVIEESKRAAGVVSIAPKKIDVPRAIEPTSRCESPARRVGVGSNSLGTVFSRLPSQVR